MNRSRELAQVLLDKARGDAWMLAHVVEQPDAPAWAMGFHAQQAVEKALKAVLTANCVDYPRTHNLGLLVDLLRQHAPCLPPDAEELARLTPFGALLRYDDDSEMGRSTPPIDRTWMRKCVERTLSWGTDILAQLT